MSNRPRQSRKAKKGDRSNKLGSPNVGKTKRVRHNRSALPMAKLTKVRRVAHPQGRTSCGDCTACCGVLAVKAIPALEVNGEPFTVEKPYYSDCPHCRPRKKRGRKPGCRIYQTRPQECATYACHWLESGILENRHRPDRCGIIFDSADEAIAELETAAGLGDERRLSLAREVWPNAGSGANAKEALGSLGQYVYILIVPHPETSEESPLIYGPTSEGRQAIRSAIDALAPAEGDS